jgi:hypothetical protein
MQYWTGVVRQRDDVALVLVSCGSGGPDTSAGALSETIQPVTANRTRADRSTGVAMRFTQRP